MANNALKDKVQKEAIQMWLDSNKRASVEIITGLGKTFIGLHALYTMPKNEGTHLFLAETVDREKDLMKDILKYNKIFGRDVLRDYNLKFYCYQTVYKWEGGDFGLVIADEIHDSLSPAYSQFYFKNNYKAIIGLSATINRKTRYELPDGSYYTKGQILDDIAPVCYTYNLDQGQEDGTARNLDVYVIRHQLEKVRKTVAAGNARKRFFQTEAKAYEYWDKEHKRAWFLPDEELKKLKIRITSTKRSNLLYNLESKVIATKYLVRQLPSKTIIFGNSLDALLKVTHNVVSSKNKEEVNDKIRDSFDRGRIDVIGSFKKLKQGANLEGLDNCVIMSYYSTDKDLIQRIGRLRNNGKKGRVFIFVTENTQEEVWFAKMFENINNLNLIHCTSVEHCISLLNK